MYSPRILLQLVNIQPDYLYHMVLRGSWFAVWGSEMTMPKMLRSHYAKFLPGILVFLAFLITHKVELMTFAYAFLMWPAFRAMRRGGVRYEP